MVDHITISDIKVWTHIGVPEEERVKEQPLWITVQIQHDLRPAGTSDSVESTINYAEVTNAIRELAKTERKTIEKFAEDIAAMILGTYKPSGSVTATIEKRIIPGTNACSVTITRP